MRRISQMIRRRRSAPTAAAFAIAILGAAASGCSQPGRDESIEAESPVPGPAAVILMIGDGMGRGAIEAASDVAAGRPGGLFLQSLPQRGEIVTGSLTGVTDSAAAGTAMACGVATFNHRVGVDASGNEAHDLVELAHEQGWSAGIVTNRSVTDGTPASFLAHVTSRDDEAAIARQEVRRSRPEVILGGGASWFPAGDGGPAETDDDLHGEIAKAGYAVAATRGDLKRILRGGAPKIFGLFAPGELEYVAERSASSGEPTLREMAMAAIETLGRNPKGFFLMIEGGLIDQAAHDRRLDRVVGQTLAFDEAVKAVAAWASSRAGVTVLVTADHETGGLEIVSPGPRGALPEATWQGSNHTNARVGIYGEGPGSETFDGKILDHRWVHAVASARIEGRPVVEPAPVLVPDGYLRDLRHTAALQEIEEMPGDRRIDSLRVDADARGLALGVEGVFGPHENALVILIDADYGAGTGARRLRGSISDVRGPADEVVSALPIDGSRLAGFGADFALVEVRGAGVKLDERKDRAGLRALDIPKGASLLKRWPTAVINYGDPVAGPGKGESLPPPSGLEAFIPWDRLYSGQKGVPAGAKLALALFFVSPDGTKVYNQALPHFPAGVDPVQSGDVPVPGLVIFEVDANGDGIAGDVEPPRIVWSEP